MKKNIYIIGSSLKDKGGIVSVMTQIEKSYLSEKYNFIHVATYLNTNIIKKVVIYLKSLFIILFNIGKIDIAHIHMSYKGSFYRKSLIILLLKMFKKPIILHMHGSCFKEFYSDLSKFGKKYCNHILNKADKIIVLSDSWKKYFSSIVKQENIIVIKNSVNVDQKCDKLKKTSECIFVFLGRQGKRKGVYDLLKSAKELNRKYSNFKLIIAGDGEINEVNKIIREEKLDNIIVNKGWISAEERSTILENADVFVLPSYNEGLPMAILEAMSYGLPCISTNVGGIPEVITNMENGILIDAGDIKALHDAMEYMIININKRQMMGRKAFENICQNYNEKNELTKLDNLYNNILT